jgi:predicted nucleotidyltransferase
VKILSLPPGRRFGTIFGKAEIDAAIEVRVRREEALQRLARHRDELMAMGVGSLALFGSVARDEAGPDSDIDVLIELGRPLDLFDLGRIQVRLEEILGQRVDLVMPDTLRPRLRAIVLAEAVRAT